MQRGTSARRFLSAPLDLAYAGNRSLKLLVLADCSQGVPNPPVPAPAILLKDRKPIQEFGTILKFKTAFLMTKESDL